MIIVLLVLQMFDIECILLVHKLEKWIYIQNNLKL